MRNRETAPGENEFISFSKVVGAAQTGPLLEAEMVSLTNKGKLRITYNWLYSALNCDPGDRSTFVWVFIKLAADQIAISPRDGYRGMSLYASVRDDRGWYVGVQAAHSADWIRAIGRDETLGIADGSLLTISLRGFNGQYIAVDSDISSHQGHAGYRLRSVGTPDVKARMWFLGITRTVQGGLGAPLKNQVTEADIQGAFTAIGFTPTREEVSGVQDLLS